MHGFESTPRGSFVGVPAGPPLGIGEEKVVSGCRRHHIVVGVCLATTLMTLFGNTLVYAAEPIKSHITVGIQPSYFEGNFGTTSNIQIKYVPTYIKYRRGNAQFKLTVPYLSVKSSGAVISSGSVVGKGGGGAVRTRSGLGDLWLQGKYTLKGKGSMPDITPYSKIKLATASHSQGLGTGENDYEFGVGTDTVIGSNLFPFAQLGYRVVGSPANLKLRNILTYEAGGSLRVTPAQFLTVMYSGHQSEQAGFSATSDAIVAWDYALRPGTGFQVFADLGLSNGSPDYGIGLGAKVRF